MKIGPGLGSELQSSTAVSATGCCCYFYESLFHTLRVEKLKLFSQKFVSLKYFANVENVK